MNANTLSKIIDISVRVALVAFVAHLGIGCFRIGVQGFSAQGVYWLRGRRITGTAGRFAGVFCFLVALFLGYVTVVLALGALRGR